MADVLTILRQYQLLARSTIRDYGGLDFGPLGEYVSAPLSIMDAGPFTTYEDLVRATIQSKLAKADTDPQMEGWRVNVIPRRKTPGSHGEHGTFPQVLVHADSSTINV